MEKLKPAFVQVEDDYTNGVMFWYRYDELSILLKLFTEKNVPKQWLEKAITRLRSIAESYFNYKVNVQIKSIIENLALLQRTERYGLAPSKKLEESIATFVVFLENNRTFLSEELFLKPPFQSIFDNLLRLPQKFNARKHNFFLREKIFRLINSLNNDKLLRNASIEAGKDFNFQKVNSENWDYIKNATEKHLMALERPSASQEIDQQRDLDLYFGCIAFKLQFFKHDAYKEAFVKMHFNQATIIYNYIEAYVTTLLYKQIDNPGLTKLKEIIQKKFQPEFAKYRPTLSVARTPQPLERTLTPIVKTDEDIEEADTEVKPKPAAAGFNTDIDMSGSDGDPLMTVQFPVRRTVSASVLEVSFDVSLPASARDRASSVTMSQSPVAFHVTKRRKDVDEIQEVGETDKVKASKIVAIDQTGQSAYPRLTLGNIRR